MFEGLQAIRKELKETKLENPDREEIHDGYQLRFVGKDYAKFITGLPTETVLVPDTEWNNQEQNKNSENIFITGDNLDALKHLENAYSGRIKMIYIDPPYNTGNDGFVYSDKFGFSEEQLREKLGLSEDEVTRIKTLEGKCSHSAWLTFMLPRLAIAKRLLSDDGVIFISIDDNEQANLKLLCDEIFTERNFVAQFVWKCRNSLQHDEPLVSKQTEQILLYTKDKKFWNSEEGIKFNRIRKPFDATEYKNPDNDPRGPWLSSGKTRNDGRPSYTVVSPTGVKFTKPWIPSPEEFKKWEDDNLIWWGVDGNAIPRKKSFLKDFKGNAISDILCDEYTDEIKDDKLKRTKRWEIGTTESGTKNLKDIFDGHSYFDYPKPWTLLKYLITIASDKDSIILDFFAGSATTAHAVMALNKEDSGNRKYIMVQLSEMTKENSEARIAGYNTIDEISRDRIKKAAKQLGDITGFKHYKLAKVKDDIVLCKIDKFNPDKPNLFNDDMLEPFSGKSLDTKLESTGSQTLLTTWLVDDGYTLTTPVNEIKLSNYTAYMPQDSHRLYLIDTGWNSEATKDLLNKIEKNQLIIQSIVVYNHSFNFTTLTELKNNLKSVLNKDIKLIERF